MEMKDVQQVDHARDSKMMLICKLNTKNGTVFKATYLKEVFCNDKKFSLSPVKDIFSMRGIQLQLYITFQFSYILIYS